MAIKGEDLVYKIQATASGFDMNEDDWYVEIHSRYKKVTIKKGECYFDGTDWYVPFNTDGLSTGDMNLVFHADIVDDKFDDGLRHEIASVTIDKLELV